MLLHKKKNLSISLCPASLSVSASHLFFCDWIMVADTSFVWAESRRGRALTFLLLFITMSPSPPLPPLHHLVFLPLLLHLFITMSLSPFLLLFFLSFCSLKIKILGMLLIFWLSGTTRPERVCVRDKEQLESVWCRSWVCLATGEKTEMRR